MEEQQAITREQVLEQIIWDTLFDEQQRILAIHMHDTSEQVQLWNERLRSRVLCLMRGKDGDLSKLVNDPEWPHSLVP